MYSKILSAEAGAGRGNPNPVGGGDGIGFFNPNRNRELYVREVGGRGGDGKYKTRLRPAPVAMPTSSSILIKVAENHVSFLALSENQKMNI